jgi:hypothetical protein
MREILVRYEDVEGEIQRMHVKPVSIEENENGEKFKSLHQALLDELGDKLLSMEIRETPPENRIRFKVIFNVDYEGQDDAKATLELSAHDQQEAIDCAYNEVLRKSFTVKRRGLYKPKKAELLSVAVL